EDLGVLCWPANLAMTSGIINPEPCQQFVSSIRYIIVRKVAILPGGMWRRFTIILGHRVKIRSVIQVGPGHQVTTTIAVVYYKDFILSCVAKCPYRLCIRVPQIYQYITRQDSIELVTEQIQSWLKVPPKKQDLRQLRVYTVVSRTFQSTQRISYAINHSWNVHCLHLQIQMMNYFIYGFLRPDANRCAVSVFQDWILSKSCPTLSEFTSFLIVRSAF
ncbi:MAG: hypothetical protein EZS28_046934, partial [Streblomastix strix]